MTRLAASDTPSSFDAQGSVRICVVGSVNLDLVASCSHLPTPGETVGEAIFSRHPGGKGANQALAARRQGADVTLVAAVGDDALAEEALELLREGCVDLSRLTTVTGRSTGVALIVVDERGENQIVVAPGANHDLGPGDVDAQGFDAVLCQLEIRDDTVLEAARQSTALFCLNAAPARPFPEPLLERADLIVVNEIEQHSLKSQLDSYGGLLVVTHGARGAEAFRRDERVVAAHPPRVDAIDTVGAGDAFCGTLVVELAQGRTIEHALSRACTAGAIAATRLGAQPSLPTSTDLDIQY
ncbi:MAG: ribokinase [Gammaproteobacteria bacterium]|nr:ribokinase [Gammaproteobacteria bacterium]